MPTFVMYKKGRRVDTVRGADPSKLRAMVEKHAPVKGPPAPMGPPGGGGRGGTVLVVSARDPGEAVKGWYPALW